MLGDVDFEFLSSNDVMECPLYEDKALFGLIGLWPLELTDKVIIIKVVLLEYI